MRLSKQLDTKVDEPVVTVESCTQVDKFFDELLTICVDFVTCNVDNVLDKATNTCISIDKSCQKQGKFFNSANVACEDFVTCSAEAGLKLDQGTNQCVDVAK